MKTKLVLAWVDNTGFELTGRYRDRLGHYPETRTIPEAKAACWGEDTPERLKQLEHHIQQEKYDHVWMGWFRLPFTGDILTIARARALAEVSALTGRRTVSPTQQCRGA